MRVPEPVESVFHGVPEEVKALARPIRLLILDVDGVLTDGGLYYTDTGLAMKRFHVRDGIGLRLIREAGIEVAVISGMYAPCVVRRLEGLGITEHYGGSDDKLAILEAVRERKGVERHEIAYMGDDWVDLAPMSVVGLPASPADAAPEVREIARYVTKTPGGRGAVRELTDFLLECRGERARLLEAWKRRT